MKRKKKLAWVVAADMGYGHQRAAFPLKYLSGGRIINANNYPGIPKEESVMSMTSCTCHRAV
jgi:hypothetical protein